MSDTDTTDENNDSTDSAEKEHIRLEYDHGDGRWNVVETAETVVASVHYTILREHKSRVTVETTFVKPEPDSESDSDGD